MNRRPFHYAPSADLGVTGPDFADCAAVRALLPQLPVNVRTLAHILSWLAPEPMPCRHLKTLTSPANASALLHALAEQQLVTINPDNDTFTMPGAVQEIIRAEQLPGDSPAPSALRATLAWVHDITPGDPDDISTWPDAASLLPHAIATATAGAEHAIPEPTAHLLNEAAGYEIARGNFLVAEPLSRRALALAADYLGDSHPEVSAALGNLAALLQNTGRLKEAEVVLRRALAINEANCGDSHPNVALDLNNLATLLQNANRLAEAEPLYRRALAIAEQHCGLMHSFIAPYLTDLALLLHTTNRLEEAETLMHRALAMDEDSYGYSNPTVAGRLNNLAQLLHDTDRLEEAEPFYRRALGIYEDSLGKGHPDTIFVRENLEMVLEKIGNSAATGG